MGAIDYSWTPVWRFVAGGHSAATGVACMTRVVTTEKETTK